MTVHYRQAEKSDVLAMARIRETDWGTEEYWIRRISEYMDCELHPQKALMPRVLYVALAGDSMVGFIAGHLTRRFGCDGELEWINVVPEHRGTGVSAELLRLLAAWFAGQNAARICVDPGNPAARRFYARHGAGELNQHWMVWDDIKVVLGER